MRRLATAILVTLLGASAALAPSLAQDVQVPDGTRILILVRSTLSALNDANRTGNYTVLRDLASPGFRQTNTAARLSEVFSELRKKNLDLAPVSVVAPKYTRPAAINQNGLLHVAGLFPTRPLNVKFEMLFKRAGNAWRLFGIHVDTPQAAPAKASQEQ